MALKRFQYSNVPFDKWHLALIGMILASAWFLLLSQYLIDSSNGLLVLRQDVLFESDAANFVNGLISDEWFPPSHSFTVVHPLIVYLWKPLGQILTFLLDLLWPHKIAGILAVRLITAIIAGAGVGCLAWLAIHHGVRISNVIPLFAVYFLFIANSVTALPDHFGISNGLLSMNFFLLFAMTRSPSNLILLCVLGFLVVGTTVTTFVFPSLCLFYALHHTKISKVSILWRYRIVIATTVILTGFLCISLVVANKATGYVSTFFNNRLIQDPARAGLYAISSMVYPAVGPVPSVVMQKDRKANMVTYEPLMIHQYNPIQVPAVIAWVVLLGVSMYHSLKDTTSRPYVCLLLIWIGFNVVLHNLWGDEFFLFSPHWSWALMSLVLLGARHLSFRFVIVAVVPILAGQIYTFMRIGDALKSISH